MTQQATACKQVLLVLCLGCLVAVAPVAGDASLGRRLLIRYVHLTSCREAAIASYLCAC
jgi:hypothetical protein